MNVVNRQTLPFAGVSHEFVGKEHGVVNSILFVTAPPGRRIQQHRHDYDEIIVLQVTLGALSATKNTTSVLKTSFRS
jgi:quercetin dioxygenase-like cupin family protein